MVSIAEEWRDFLQSVHRVADRDDKLNLIAEYLNLTDYVDELRSSILLDFYSDVILFCQQRVFTPEQSLVFFNISRDILNGAAANEQTMEESFNEFKTRILRRTSGSSDVQLFSADQAKAIVDFFVSGFYRHYNLYCAVLLRDQEIAFKRCKVDVYLPFEPKDLSEAMTAQKYREKRERQEMAQAEREQRRYEAECARLAKEHEEEERRYRMEAEARQREIKEAALLTQILDDEGIETEEFESNVLEALRQVVSVSGDMARNTLPTARQEIESALKVSQKSIVSRLGDVESVLSDKQAAEEEKLKKEKEKRDRAEKLQQEKDRREKERREKAEETHTKEKPKKGRRGSIAGGRMKAKGK